MLIKKNCSPLVFFEYLGLNINPSIFKITKLEKKIDSRKVLQEKLQEVNELGYKFYVGPEIEYYFLDSDKKNADMDDAGYFDQTSDDNKGSDLRRECVLSLEEMGIPVRSSHHEVSSGQHEIGLKHTDALTMADSIVTTRLVVIQTATKLGGFATFMPRPFETLNGSGLHFHLSLYKGDNNAFSSKGKDRLSKIGKGFLAGLVEYSPKMSLVTNQWLNSYKRLLPNLEAPVAGTGNELQISNIVRIPHIYDNDYDNSRIEFRLPDSACNPYLALAAILHAGMLGIKDNLQIPKNWESNIPNTLNEAIKESQKGNFLQDAIGIDAYNSIVVNKEKETRWSLNCRFKSIFSPYLDKKIGEFFLPITTRAATEIGINYKSPFKDLK